MEIMRSRSDFESEIQDVTNRHLSELFKLWTMMGYDHEALNDRMNTARTYIDETYDRMVGEERGHMDSILGQIQDLEEERQSLMKELGRRYLQDEDKFNNSQITYLQLVRDLTEEVEGFRKEKEKRMVEVNMLHNDDKIASKAVDEKPFAVRPGKIPTDEEMQQLKDHIKKMKNLKSHRSTQFESSKNQILELYSELDCEPNNTMERTIICGPKNEIILSTKNMEYVEKMLAHLQAELDANRTTMDKMLQRTDILCTRLAIEKNQYLSPEMVGYSTRHLKEFATRLEELEEIKMAHLAEFVEKSRQELRVLWDQCYYGQEQRNAFLLMFSTDYNEDMLDEHDKEVERLKGFLKDHVGIFGKVNEWQGWWDQKKAIHNRSNDPNRLFDRKGNNLLKEQNEQKEVNRTLPKVEKELTRMVQEYDDHHDTKFTLAGIPFEEYIREIKSELVKDTEMDKIDRKERNRKLVEHETIYGVGKALTPMGNLTRTPNKSRRMDSKSRLNTPGSMRNLRNGEILGTTSSSSKRPGAHVNPVPKRMRMNENSVIFSGNLHNSMQSVDSTASYKDQDVISSTFRQESKLNHPGSATRRTPLRSTQLKSSTPVRSNLRTPISNNTFKTPTSRARVASSRKDETRDRTLRSGSKIPFKF